METQGFYKNQDGVLIYAPNFAENKNYLILKEEKDSYVYPIDGWYWFDSEELARIYFGIPIEEEKEG